MNAPASPPMAAPLAATIEFATAFLIPASDHPTTLREVIEASRAVTNAEVPIIEGARRAGDATALVSGSARAVEELDRSRQSGFMEKS